MAIAGFAVLFLAQVFQLIVGVDSQSPCPNYFRYVRHESSNEIMGRVEIPKPERGIALRLKVALSISAALPSKYVGRLELAKSRKDSVKAVQRGWPLEYRVRFPLRYPIPVLTGLWLNEQRYCAGPRASGQIVTSIVLEHTLYPPGVLALSESQRPFAQLPRQEAEHPPRQPTKWPDTGVELDINGNPEASVDRPESDNRQQELVECGRAASGASGGSEASVATTGAGNVNRLIARGSKTYPGQWPWLAAIFVVKIDFEFQCAGTLATTKHVITAAHCFTLDNNVTLPASAMLVSLGRYRLRDWREKGSVNREVADYRLHPDYKGQGSADSDLAVLVLREAVRFGSSIGPVCLWSGPSELAAIVGKAGYVVGWGRDEFGSAHQAEPRMSRVPIVSQEDCLWSNANFVAFTSNRTFCAGLRNGSGPCNGDSGSGLVMRDSNTGRYHLRGVVSSSLLDTTTMSCDLAQYVVYVDVAQYLDWIRNQLADQAAAASTR